MPSIAIDGPAIGEMPFFCCNHRFDNYLKKLKGVLKKSKDFAAARSIPVLSGAIGPLTAKRRPTIYGGLFAVQMRLRNLITDSREYQQEAPRTMDADAGQSNSGRMLGWVGHAVSEEELCRHRTTQIASTK